MFKCSDIQIYLNDIKSPNIQILIKIPKYQYNFHYQNEHPPSSLDQASLSYYQHPPPAAAEARMWGLAGFAGLADLAGLAQPDPLTTT
jgi:hypothetical protein